MRRALSLALCLVACGSEDPPGAPDASGATDGAPPEQRWLPLATGNRWTYLVTPLGLPPEQKSQTIMQVEEVPEKSGQRAFFVVTEKVDGMTHSWQEDRGNMIVRHREVSFDSPGAMNGLELYDPFKLRVDETDEHTTMGVDWVNTYTESINGGAPFARSEHWYVEAIAEDVTVPAGTFPCLRVRRMGTEFGQADKTFWFARGVGKVKEAGDQTEELMSYSLP